MGDFYSIKRTGYTVLYPALSTQIKFFDNKAGLIFVPKFYHERRTKNFLEYLLYVGKYGPDNAPSEFPENGRKYYIYKKTTTGSSAGSILATDSDWPFPDTYYKSIGSTVRGFSLFYLNLSTSLKNLFQPTPSLLNTESGTEETSTVPTQYSFYSGQQPIEESMTSYDNVPKKYFINESYFLYDKSELIKETYIAALNKKHQFMAR